METNIFELIKIALGKIRNELLIFSIAVIILIGVYSSHWRGILIVYIIAVIFYTLFKMYKESKK